MKPVYSGIWFPLLIILLFATPVMASDWVEYGKSDKGDIYLCHKGSMKQRTEDIVQIWIKLVFSDEGRKNYVQRLRKSGESTEGYDKLSHVLSLVEIDRKKPKFRILYITEYDKEDTVIFRGLHDAPWKDILPDSSEDNLRKKSATNK